MIRNDLDYTGIRVSLEASLDKLRIPLTVDITTGDPVTPQAINHSYNLMLENRCIEVLSYNLATVIAEKIETILSRGIANIRMRDFHDLYILVRMKEHAIVAKELAGAVKTASLKRGTADLLPESKRIFAEIFTEENMRKSWEKYQKGYTYAEEVSWNDVKLSVDRLWEISNIG